MRVGMRRTICLKIIYIKRVVACILLAAIIAICLSGFFATIYKPYITSMAISRANNLLQQIVNQTVLEIINTNDYGSFVSIIRDKEDKIIGIETDALSINKFKSTVISKITQKIKIIQGQRYGIPILAFLNNPFISEKGPKVHIRVKPLGTISADLENKFESVGINQTKHEINLKFKTQIVIVMPAISIEHTVSSTMPVAQTVIVGEVPESYTNVSTAHDKLDDTVLQLAGN